MGLQMREESQEYLTLASITETQACHRLEYGRRRRRRGWGWGSIHAERNSEARQNGQHSLSPLEEWTHPLTSSLWLWVTFSLG